MEIIERKCPYFKYGAAKRANARGFEEKEKQEKGSEREYLVLGGRATQTALFRIACSPLKGALKSVGVRGREEVEVKAELAGWTGG